MNRLLTFNIFRHSPGNPESKPHMQQFMLKESPGMTLFIALNLIRDEQDATLAFDFVCRAGVCGSCAMIINGSPGLACRTLTGNLPDQVTLLPLPGFEHIADLSVNTGRWMQRMSKRLETWVHLKDEPDIDHLEDRMEPEQAEAIYELDRCIECGCCFAACGTAQMRDDFIGAVGINKIARFKADPRDKRSNAEYYEVIGQDEGVFGCMSLLACQDVCPKNLSLQTQIAHIRRTMVKTSFNL